VAASVVRTPRRRHRRMSLQHVPRTAFGAFGETDPCGLSYLSWFEDDFRRTKGHPTRRHAAVPAIVGPVNAERLGEVAGSRQVPRRIARLQGFAVTVTEKGCTQQDRTRRTLGSRDHIHAPMNPVDAIDVEKPAGPNMICERGVGPRKACDAGSSIPPYASVSTMRATTRRGGVRTMINAPMRSRATSSDARSKKDRRKYIVVIAAHGKRDGHEMTMALTVVISSQATYPVIKRRNELTKCWDASSMNPCYFFPRAMWGCPHERAGAGTAMCAPIDVHTGTRGTLSAATNSKR
jgi:hypothetical protein